MKRFLFLSGLFMMIHLAASGQEKRFNEELDRFCKIVLRDVKDIPLERKAVLDHTARQLAKKKYVLFTCKTNSRRTILLQIWAQTAFYYYGLYSKQSFSVGDTVTNVYPGIADVLKQSGFTCLYLEKEEPKRFIVSINKEYPIDILLSRNEIGTIDTSKGVVVNICTADEESGKGSNLAYMDLPYESPVIYEKTMQEKFIYKLLNRQIAAEMLYLAERTKEYVIRIEHTGY